MSDNPVSLIPIEDPFDPLFEPTSEKVKELLRPQVIEDMRDKEFPGIPVAQLKITLDTDNGDDILMTQVDPENALGYQTFDSEDDYFSQLQGGPSGNRAA